MAGVGTLEYLKRLPLVSWEHRARVPVSSAVDLETPHTWDSK